MKVGDNRLGGHVVKVLGPGLEWHYYAHLDRFADLRVGDAVSAGRVLGYVGNSGDAVSTPTHLHYGIYRRLGGAMDPYPRLR
jgi:murein DD-endopeptidase MepM/ murein hydrolase activator NlpD